MEMSYILILLESCLQTCMTYTIAECVVNKLLMMDRGTVRNMQCFIPKYESWNFNSGNYLFTNDTKQIHVSKFYCPSVQSPALCTTRCQGLSPCDFDLIPKMKEPLRGIRFRTVPEILQAVDRTIRTINTTGAAKGILRLPHRWQRVVHNAGDYIEGQ